MKVKQFLKWICAIGFFSLAIACSDDTPVNPTILSTQQAAQKAQSIVAGQVTSSTLDSADNEWDVKIMTASGALLKVELVQATGAIDKIEGIEGPFTYEVRPGAGLINFSTAKTAAVKAMTGITDNIKSWELKHDSAGAFLYEFIFLDANNQERKVKINAANGQAIP